MLKSVVPDVAEFCCCCCTCCEVGEDPVAAEVLLVVELPPVAVDELADELEVELAGELEVAPMLYISWCGSAAVI